MDALKKLAEARLYGILDLGYTASEDVEKRTADLLQGGVDLLQLRAKGKTRQEIEELAAAMLPLTRVAGVPLILNDYPDIAARVGCDGVHIGQDDDAVALARQATGGRCLVGKSTHSLKQAVAAVVEGADYIGFGPLYATGTKPDYVPIGLKDIAAAQSSVTVPMFCIGGVNDTRLTEILAAGAKRVVVVSAFLQAADVVKTVREFKSRLIAE